MQFSRVRSPVGSGDLHEDVIRTGFGILHEDVKVAVILEDAGIEQFILELVSRTPAVRIQQIGIGIGSLRILIQILHV
jgi:hypothetical protein